MAKKKTLLEVLEKYESGKQLSKADCKVVLDEIYTCFVDSGKRRTDLLDILIRNAEKVVEKLGRPLSDIEAESYYGLHACNNHTAKMAGNESWSTNNKCNKRCAKNKQCDGSICAACFADAQLNTFPTMEKGLTINYLLLNYTVLPVSILPLVNRQFARIESFGDVETVFQAMNYCNLMTAHTLNTFVQFGA